MPRSDGEGVLGREGFQVLRIAFDPDQAGPGRLAERDAEMDAWNGTDEGFVPVRLRWHESRTRRRLATLVDLGVLWCARDLADNWTKVFEVVDRPHVPAALALELGA